MNAEEGDTNSERDDEQPDQREAVLASPGNEERGSGNGALSQQPPIHVPAALEVGRLESSGHVYRWLLAQGAQWVGPRSPRRSNRLRHLRLLASVAHIEGEAPP